MEVSLDRAICVRCGKMFGRHKGNFPVSYAHLYKGLGYIPICRECIDSLYSGYLSQCNSPADSVRQVCRKLDLYWSYDIFKIVMAKSATHSVMTSYIAKINSVSYVGKSYDDTLKSEGTLWAHKANPVGNSMISLSDPQQANQKIQKESASTNASLESIPDEVIDFWGSGYTSDMYVELEKRYSSWISRFPENTVLDVGTEALIKQICALEMDISRDRAQGKSVDKSVNVLNTLLGSANLKPAQRQNSEMENDAINNPLGVWIYRYEHQRPLPEIDEDLKDVNHLLRYFFVWLGHVFKMLGKKTGFTKMYQAEIDRLKVERPEFADEDDEDFLMDALYEDDEDDGGDTG